MASHVQIYVHIIVYHKKCVFSTLFFFIFKMVQKNKLPGTFHPQSDLKTNNSPAPVSFFPELF